MTDRPSHRPRCHTDTVADRELLDRLRAAGHGWLIDVLASPNVYAANGRLNALKAAAAARMSESTFRRRLLAARHLLAAG